MKEKVFLQLEYRNGLLAEKTKGTVKRKTFWRIDKKTVTLKALTTRE